MPDGNHPSGSASPVRSCRACGASLSAFMTFGRMPMANPFLTPEQMPHEYFFELQPACCERCGLFQLLEQPPAERIFHGEYPFFSSSSVRMQQHFGVLVADALARISRRPGALVVEIGCNDGTLLAHVQQAGYRTVGIEPSENVAAVARERGIEVVNAFFDEATAAVVAETYGRAQLVVATNVICHVATLHSVAAGLSRLVAPDGMVVIEEPYLGDMIAKTSYDQIYNEHVFMLSVRPMQRVCAEHGLTLTEAVPQSTHGGSMRYLLAPAGSATIGASVDRQLASERAQRLDDPRTYDAFRARCERSRSELRKLLSGLRADGKRIAGYAATSKSATVTNYCGLGPDDIDFIADSTPLKHGKLSPGMHIPIRSTDDFRRRPPDFAILFAWNHASEIFAKERAFTAGGGRWITYVPDVAITD